MAKHTNEDISIFSTEIDYYTTITDVLKKWWLIIMVSVSISLLTYIVVKETYQPQYNVNATYVITTQGANTSVFSNLATAQDIATRFSQIINSPTLQKKVCEELGVSEIDGTITAEIVPETNLMNLVVKADSPQHAFEIMRAVMNNYRSISDYMIGNAVMEILQQPEIPKDPEIPLDIKSYMVKAFLISIAAMIVLVAVFSLLKDTIRKSSDVEKKLDTKLIGSISHENKNKSFKSKFSSKKTSLIITKPLISFSYVESIKKIATKISNRMDSKGLKTLLVTSYMENEGKSTVAANIALTLSNSNKKVLLIDADLRNPAQYKVFEMFDNEIDEFGDILEGKKKVENLFAKVENTNLYTIFNKKTYSNSTELIASGRMEKLLNLLKKYFDYIIIDSSPMAIVSDTEEIAEITDASLIVVREHMTEARDINDMIAVLNGCKSSYLGCVFNDAHTKVLNTATGYGKYYGGYERAFEE